MGGHLSGFWIAKREDRRRGGCGSTRPHVRTHARAHTLARVSLQVADCVSGRVDAPHL